MDIQSKINPLLTLEYMQMESENKYFDRKSGQIRVTDLAPHISAFANADGGTLVIGISDKMRTLEGVNSCGENKRNYPDFGITVILCFTIIFSSALY